VPAHGRSLIRKYPQAVGLSSNCHGAVVEPWDGAREGDNFEIELPNRLIVERAVPSGTPR
jgi:hypothetical protein